MTRHWTDWLIMLAIIVALGLVVAAWPVRAQVPYGGSTAEWFKSLKGPHPTIPGKMISCCDQADCKRTEAELRDGRWWALSRWGWIPIPEEKVLPGFSIFAEAILCETQYGREPNVWCFLRSPGVF